MVLTIAFPRALASAIQLNQVLDLDVNVVEQCVDEQGAMVGPRYHPAERTSDEDTQEKILVALISLINH